MEIKLNNGLSFTATGYFDRRASLEIKEDNLKAKRELTKEKRRLKKLTSEELVAELYGEMDFSYREAEPLKDEIVRRLLETQI